MNFVGGVSVQTYLLGIPIANNAPVGNVSGAINEGIESDVQVYLEIGNINHNMQCNKLNGKFLKIRAKVSEFFIVKYFLAGHSIFIYGTNRHR
jgi:hypothetical protein